ncbi:hypothetical protein SH1V18_39120 [Vallitalea longa]|uniref:Lipocalin-like domain-containing protein n=1 Tax=Vallitalea longa TaxID=2936439 RepID=A0A9W5YCG1_9FIRM|nr:hypothetical protein [Vallitalea longa]GKX31432.1 hypothetical protein SH1V18_39120 [Vallitalea longa]
MKHIIGIFTLIIFLLTGCAAETDVKTNVETDVVTDITDVKDDIKEINEKGNENNIPNKKDDISIDDDNICEKFIGDWKIKAYSEEDFFVTAELDSQDNGIGIYQDHIIVYACEVNDYILFRYDIEEIDENNLVVRINEKETSSGRKINDNTKVSLVIEENNDNILKCSFTKETDEGTYNNTYIYERDTEGLLNEFYVDKQENNNDYKENDELIRKIQNEWFLDYDDIKETEFLRFDDENGIRSYDIIGNSIWSKHYDLEGNLLWKSGEENYKAYSISDDSVVLEITNEQGDLDNIIGVYYLIQFKDDEVTIKEFDYFSDTWFRFNDEKVVNDSLESVVILVNHKNNLFAFNNEQRIFFNELIGKWGALKEKDYDAYNYNLVINNYNIDFYKYATGFMEAINFTIEEINIDEKEVLLKINQYTWSDEMDCETKYVDKNIKILLNEEETKLTLTILNDDEFTIFDMDEGNIGDIEFEKTVD